MNTLVNFGSAQPSQTGQFSFGRNSLFAPRGTPKTVIQLLSAELKRVLSSPDVIEALVRNGNDVVYSTPEELGTYVKTQTELIRKLAKTRNIKFE